MFKIIVTPNPILVKKSERVTRFDKKLEEIVKKMSKTLDVTEDPKGVGLAAPQVGISKRIFLAKPDDKNGTKVFINPQILDTKGNNEVPNFPNSKKVEAKKPKNSKKKLLEGCLSIPNIWGNVARKKEVKLKYQDEKGNEYIKTFTGFLATIIQHEIDHLDGTLFTKHVLAQNEQLYRSYKNEKGEDEFEEIKV